MTQPTQVRHPWRATLRTVVAGGIALLSLLPTIAAVGHVDTVEGVTQLLAVSAGITRVLAIPAVDGWLRRYVPWLAAAK
jgi:hypothetical protein